MKISPSILFVISGWLVTEVNAFSVHCNDRTRDAPLIKTFATREDECPYAKAGPMQLLGGIALASVLALGGAPAISHATDGANGEGISSTKM